MEKVKSLFFYFSNMIRPWNTIAPPQDCLESNRFHPDPSDFYFPEEFLMFFRFESEARVTLTHHQHDQFGILQDVLQMRQTFM